MNPSKLCDLSLFYNPNIHMSPSDILKTTMDDALLLPQQEHVQEGPVLLIFVVLLLLMTTNVLVFFVRYDNLGVTFSFNFKPAL